MSDKPIESSIRVNLQQIDPIHCDIVNESFKHNVPDGSESHFKIIIVSESFDGKMLVARHRIVNELLKEQLQRGVHALSLHTMTPEEWFEKEGPVPDSPKCLGHGSQVDIIGKI